MRSSSATTWRVPEVWVHLGVVSRLARVRASPWLSLRSASLVLPTARLAADLDNLSGGRFILGLGHGWNATEFAQLGLRFPPVPERQAAWAESIEIIRGVWDLEPFSYRGHYHSTERERVVPLPVQQPLSTPSSWLHNAIATAQACASCQDALALDPDMPPGW